MISRAYIAEYYSVMYAERGRLSAAGWVLWDGAPPFDSIGVRIKFSVQDAYELNLHDRYSLVFIAYYSILHFDSPGKLSQVMKEKNVDLSGAQIWNRFAANAENSPSYSELPLLFPQEVSYLLKPHFEIPCEFGDFNI